MLEHSKARGIEKWEYFWELRNAWANSVALARPITPLAMGRWTFWRTREHQFPLCDSPVMMGRDSLMAILSPRLLLEIDLGVQVPDEQWVIWEGISDEKYSEFRSRAIANTFKEILFDQKGLLEEWAATPEWVERVRDLGDPISRKRCIEAAALRVMWGLLGFGRVPDDFESWASQLFEP
jgi:hypothetical protein